MTAAFPTWTDGTEPCRSSPEEFVESGPGNRAHAKAICATCAKRVTCLEWALETRQESGIWGGKTAHERKIILRGRGTPSTKEHR